jgi:hypothetical protein
MRLISKFIIVLLFVALSAGGSGIVLASAVCSHLSVENVSVDDRTDHNCCPADKSNHGSDCNTNFDSTSQGNFEDHQRHASVQNSNNNSLTLRAVPACGNCLIKSAPLPLFVRVSDEGRTFGATEVAPPSSSSVLYYTLNSFKLPVIHRQGSPPIVSLSKQILFGIFLI